MNATAPALKVVDLRVDLEGTGNDIVKDISFEVAPGEIIGIIGESGSGKTTVLTSLLGYTRAGAEITGGQVLVGDQDILTLAGRPLQHVRGGVVAYVPQDPGGALNPALRLGVQLRETLAAHGITDRDKQDDRIARILDEVKLPIDHRFLQRFPHELSGGQQQRVTIAMAFLCEPAVAVLDEPTTGLDVTTQAHVLTAVRELCQSHQTAGVFVSHDIAAVSGLADHIAVMYGGRIVEYGTSEEVTTRPTHAYTRSLIDAIPDPRQSHGEHVASMRVRTGRAGTVEVLERPAVPEVSGVRGADTFLSVRGLNASYNGNQILRGLDLEVARGTVMGIVGESGSGKSTLARSIGGLHAEASGDIVLDGKHLRFGARHRSKADRLAVQYIFQNATSALNPRKSIGESIAEPMIALGLHSSAAARRERVAELLTDVALKPDLADRYPVQLSGGERQRVTVARALATTPKLLICDEITSSLDVSVQASILDLIGELRERSDLTLLFVTHNLGVVRAISDQVAVLNQGVIVELGDVDSVLDHPEHPYTQRLLADTPTMPSVTTDTSRIA